MTLSKKTREAVTKKIIEIVHDLGNDIFTISQENVAKDATDTGFLLKSGSIEFEKNGFTIRYAIPYASFVEYGTDPHRPPFEPIFKWVRRKITSNEKKAKSIAWAIVNKIAKEGTPPKAYLRNAMDKAFNNLGQKYNGKTIKI